MPKFFQPETSANIIQPIPESVGLNFQNRKNRCEEVLSQFEQKLFDEIQWFNAEIHFFNQLEADSERKKVLYEIYLRLIELDQHFYTKDIHHSRAYCFIFHKCLLNDIQKQFRLLGITPMEFVGLDHHFSSDMPTDLIAHLADLSPVLLNAFVHQLEIDSVERSFTYKIPNQAYKIEKLESFSGRTTYQATAIQNGIGCLITLEHAMRRPQSALLYAKKACPELFSYTPLCRPFTDNALTGTLHVQTLSTFKSLLRVAIDFQNPENQVSLTDRVYQATDLYQQMAFKLLELQSAGFIFPNAKNMNWSIEDGRVIIHHGQSIQFATMPGLAVHPHIKNFHLPSIYTPGYKPPELNGEDLVNEIEPMHVWMLGVNLYEFFCEDNSVLEQLTVESDQYFQSAFFQSELGQPFADLIKQCLQQSPKERITLSQAMEQLAEIQEHIKALNFKKSQAIQDINTYFTEAFPARPYFQEIETIIDTINTQQSLHSIDNFVTQAIWQVDVAQLHLKAAEIKLEHIRQFVIKPEDIQMRDFYNTHLELIQTVPNVQSLRAIDNKLEQLNLDLAEKKEDFFSLKDMLANINFFSGLTYYGSILQNLEERYTSSPVEGRAHLLSSPFNSL